MSEQPCLQPQCDTDADGAVSLLIRPRVRDLGGFSVRRVLPSPSRRMVGPFIFFDQMGPSDFTPGEGIDVRPHPHVCLATVTYLFEGTLMHRDSLGSAQLIEPGAVNLMTAGRGIVHSERAGPDRARASSLFGIQSWMALPAAREETAPDFQHYPAAQVPLAELDAHTSARVVMGEAFGVRSPVQGLSPTLYVDLQCAAGAAVPLPRPAGYELAVYVVSGGIAIEGSRVQGGVMAVLRDDVTPVIHTTDRSRLIVIGGAPLGERHIWWNFVASDPERIERAKADWRDGRFPKVPGDDQEFIPLPE